ncbi:hypothetical protein [Pontimicrobium sp. MEBiC01747]
MKNNDDNDSPKGFNNKDLTDERNLLDWKSKYPKKATYWILFEFIYLFCFVFFAPLLAAACYLKVFPNFLSVEIILLNGLEPYLLACLGGAFGGALYGLKWTYHCVAKGLWHSDRRAWRMFIPIVGTSFALVFSILILSNFLKIFDKSLLQNRGIAFVIGFFSGYFSDKAAAKLVEVSNSIFGITSKD